MTLLCIYSMYDLKPDIYYISLFFLLLDFHTVTHTHTHTNTQVTKNKICYLRFFLYSGHKLRFCRRVFFPVVSAGQKQENSSTQTHSSVSENTTEHTDTLQVLHSWDLLFSKSHGLVKKNK